MTPMNKYQENILKILEKEVEVEICERVKIMVKEKLLFEVGKYERTHRWNDFVETCERIELLMERASKGSQESMFQLNAKMGMFITESEKIREFFQKLDSDVQHKMDSMTLLQKHEFELSLTL